MPGLDDDFGIASGNKLVSSLFKLLPQLVMVIDGAVKDNSQAQHIVDERLMRTLAQVHDAQPSMAETPRSQSEYAFTIRAACRLHGIHFYN
jgi:hypothetical protein